jgi:hypothetical protein
MKKVFFLFLIFQIGFLQAQEIPKKNTQKAFGQINFMSINMPNLEIPNEANMGFTGIHYNLYLNNWSYAGIGFYGSVAGQRGGFFTLGVNAGIKKNITENFFFDTGFHFGGGGGAAAADGGGAFILPHANLGYNFKHFSITSGWSYVNFFDSGLIKNHQLNFAIQFPLSFDYALNNQKEKEVLTKDFNTSNWQQKTKKMSLLFHLNNLKVTSKADATTGEVLNGKTIRLAGFEFDAYLAKNWFAFLKVDGAYDGIQAGYMDVILGAGYQFSMNKNRTNIIAKFGLGAGGGGGVDTKGGFLLYPDISIEQKIFNDIYLSINKGYLLTPDSYFATSTFGVGVKYYAQTNGTDATNKTYQTGVFKGFETSVGHDVYFNAKRGINPSENLHQISMQINFELNKNFYVAGQTSFANFGNAGAYAEGIVGLGLKTTALENKKTTFFAQVLAGAAGGGNISTGQGLILKPSIGMAYKLNKTLSFNASGGYVKAIDGELASTFINLGIKYSFSFLKLK